ncbi:hypothetical protein GCM10008934_24720 [Virgibacillus salarius]
MSEKLITLYVEYIIKGPEYKTYSEVPDLLKPKVKEVLIEKGREDLINA